eukprot:TRINITY_DN3963_c0_g1_i2.p1 TRINITY_DN3963_c0_g1~~TRINITY_DN3963_c0_g1_i2.p1  ORF type:complete len:293 (-),score=45.29 TRINITY_DN3963_c0_g1_i2:629-1507(-)
MEPERSAAGTEKGADGMSNYVTRMPIGNHQVVMTEAQLDTLRRQISVYSTICNQLVEMHKVMSQQAASSRDNMLYDPVMGGPGFRPSARQRWTPSQSQLNILERVYELSNGTPSKQKIKDITTELSQHGPVSETNVYNWFQNRKARAKRKQSLLNQKEGDSEADTDCESSKEKRLRNVSEFKKEEIEYGEKNSNSYEINQGTLDMGSGHTESKSQMHEFNYDMGMTSLGFKGTDMDAVQCWNAYATKQKDFDHIQENISSSLMLMNKADLKGNSLGCVTLNGATSGNVYYSQ